MRPCENLSIQVAQESLYYRVAVAVAAPCISWDNNSANVHWLIAFATKRSMRVYPFFVIIRIVCKIRINVNDYDESIECSRQPEKSQYNFVYTAVLVSLN